MTKSVVIVGAGIIGAAAAFRMAQAGADVVVVDAGLPAATAASFGWINGSFYLSQDHFRLRVAGMEAWARLSREVALPVARCGCLSWEFSGAEMERERAALAEMGYEVETLSRNEVMAREPRIAGVPEAVLSFPAESIAEPAATAQGLIAAAQALGARLVRGMRITGFTTSGEAVTGVRTEAGVINADEVLVAAGTGTEALLATLDIPLPMAPRPAYVLETCPVVPVLSHVLATDTGEVRQRPDGALVMPCAVSHQGDSAETMGVSALEAGNATLARLRALFPTVALDMAQVALGHRPMPADTLPAVGRVRSGLSVAVMHSGITLGAVMGEVLTQEVLGEPTNQSTSLLGGFRPARFTNATVD